MNQPLMRRRRLPNGQFGPLEKVFGGETMEERVERIESENATLAMMVLQLTMNSPTPAPEEEAGDNA